MLPPRDDNCIFSAYGDIGEEMPEFYPPPYVEQIFRTEFANDSLLSSEQKKKCGLQIEEMLGNYSMNGETHYDYESFTNFYHHFYGNCYTFNSVNCKKDIIKESISNEKRLGFKLVLNIGNHAEFYESIQDEYEYHHYEKFSLEKYPIGLVISIHNQSEDPFAKNIEQILSPSGHSG